MDNREVSLVIKKSSLLDIPKISKCHINAFNNSLSSILGFKYVNKMLDWYFTNKNTSLFHIEDANGNCIAYCGLLINRGNLRLGSTSSIIQHTLWTGLSILLLKPWLLMNKKIIKEYSLLFKNIFIYLKLNSTGYKKTSQITNWESFPKLGLIAIAVDKNYQGKGVGKLLLNHIYNFGLVNNLKSVYLTVAASNLQAISLYIKNGYEIIVDNDMKMMERKIIIK